MNYPVADILRDVRITLDQNQTESIIVDDDDTLELDEVITEKIPAAGMQILQVVPLRMIDGTKPLKRIDDQFQSSYTTDSNGWLRVNVPHDYLRLAIFKAADWDIPVREAVLDNTDTYKAAKSSFEGIKPNIYRPLVFETEDTEGPALIGMGSESEGVELELGRYVAIPRIIDGVFSFPKLLYNALIYQTAALVCIAYKDAAAQSLFSTAQSYMGLPPQQDTK